MARAEAFEELRPMLFSIAYRILGRVSEAEDAVQETWIRYADSGIEPDSLKSYLSVIVTRVSFDVLRSARVRRETYVGQWFPEPLPTDGLRSEPSYEDPERTAELADSVSMAALLLLERLTPLERAVFVLREVFGFSFAETSAAVDRSETACRQLASRARRHMAARRPRFDADPKKQSALAGRFFDAVREGNLLQLQELLASEVEALNDSGGLAGGKGGTFTAERGAKVLVAGVTPLFAIGTQLEQCELNGQPGAVLRDRHGRVICTWILEIVGDRIQRVHSVTNPEKLGHLGPVSDIQELARERARFLRLRQDSNHTS